MSDILLKLSIASALMGCSYSKEIDFTASPEEAKADKLENRLSKEDIVRAAEESIYEYDYNKILERMKSEEYRSNPFHVGGKKVILEYSLEEGIKYLQELAADSIVPYEGSFFFSKGKWIRLSSRPVFDVFPTRELNPLIEFISSADASDNVIKEISENHEEGIFAHYHTIKAIINIGHEIKSKAYTRLGVKIEDKLKDIIAGRLPSAKDGFFYAMLKRKYAEKKDFGFLVCSEDSVIFLNIEKDYMKRLFEVTINGAKKQLMKDMRWYLEYIESLYSKNASLNDCIEGLNESMMRHNIGFRVSLYKQ